MGVNAPPRPAPRRSVPQQPRAAGTLSLVPPRAELRGRAGPGRTPGSRTRPPGPAGGGIGRAPAWAQPPWSSGRRSFGSWRGAPWGGCTGELGGVPGRGRVRMPPFHPGVDGQREKREDTLAWCGEAHPAVQDSVLWMLSSILSGPLSPPPRLHLTPPWAFFFEIVYPSLFSGSTCLLSFYFISVSTLWVPLPLTSGSLSPPSDQEPLGSVLTLPLAPLPLFHSGPLVPTLISVSLVISDCSPGLLSSHPGSPHLSSFSGSVPRGV